MVLFLWSPLSSCVVSKKLVEATQMSHNETQERSLPCNRYTLLCKVKAIVQTVSYLSNDLTRGLSPMDTSPCSHILEGYLACLPGLCVPESTECAVKDGCLKQVHCVVSLFRHWVM